MCSDKYDVLLEREHFYLLEDRFPNKSGHLLMISKRHITSSLDLNKTEWQLLRAAIQEGYALLKTRDNLVIGFNTGISVGSDAGQQLHICICMSFRGEPMIS
ncbi:MAG: HIT domain-containing protein [Deltaproteobacteria bacterium]|nr:HIT domain-containing protein [Deltaproteobacteria bacterium]MBW2072400.1 HIT domain-containing protein [Deltaproteobacteria bacterium]